MNMTAKLSASERLQKVLVILPWLFEKGEVSIQEAAKRFDMSPSQIIKELELAACCGLPPYTPDKLIDLIISGDSIIATPGSLLVRPQRLSPGEGFALASAARTILKVLGPSSDDKNHSLARALTKLEKVLGSYDDIHIDLDHPIYLDVIRDSVQKNQLLEIGYYSISKDEQTKRIVEPYEVFNKEGHWYLAALCRLVQGKRIFRIDRIFEALPLEEKFEPDKNKVFDRDILLEDDMTKVEIIVEKDIQYLIDEYNPLSVIDIDEQHLLVTLPVGGQAWLERLLLRLGPQAQVVTPTAFVDLGSKAAQSILDMYKALSKEGILES